VPTFREVDSLPILTERLEALQRDQDLDLEVLVMDDESRDGTREWANEHAPGWLRLVERTENFGLSPAVVDGIALATRPWIVVMDADLSHPPEKIPEMIGALEEGAELVIGSRHVEGSSTDEAWHWLRSVNSRIATWLARPLTTAHDPMSGFLAFRRAVVERATMLDPIGFKIGLELIVKCHIERVGEIPIHFSDRQGGESKLNLKEQLRYLRHLTRLYRYRYGPGRRRRT